MLLGGPTGRVLGVLNTWNPDEDTGIGTTTFGPGSDSRSSVRDWLQRKAPQQLRLT